MTQPYGIRGAGGMLPDDRVARPPGLVLESMAQRR